MRRNLFCLAALGLTALTTGCFGNKNAIPQPGSKEYSEFLSAFYTGTISVQTADDKHDLAPLEKAAELAPGEPAVWANLAIIRMRSSHPDKTKAAEAIQKAIELAPDNDQILAIQALLLDKQGKFAESLAAYQKATAKNPENLKALFSLAEMAERLNGPDKDKIRKDAFEKILAKSPNNLAAQVQIGQALASGGDRDGLKTLLQQMESRTSLWPADAKEHFNQVKNTVQSGAPQTLLREFRLIERLIKSTREFQLSRIVFNQGEKFVGEPLQQLIKVVNPPATPAVPDTGLSYTTQPSDAATVAVAFALDEKAKPITVIANEKGIGLAGKPQVPGPGKPTQIIAFDFDDLKTGQEKDAGAKGPHLTDQQRDFHMELAAVGSGGLRIYETTAHGALKEITAQTKLPATILNQPYTGIWTVDIEADGDLDLMLSPATGHPIVLQNNGDHTFTVTPPKFDAVACPVTAFAWGDFDGDGDPDPAFVDAKGTLIPYSNDRSGFFTKQTPPSGLGQVSALAVAEVTGDTRLDLIALQNDGQLVGIADGVVKPLAKTTLTGAKTLIATELDNNGGTDLLVSAGDKSEALLADVKTGTFAAQPIAIAQGVSAVADLDGDGYPDLVGVTGGKLSTGTAKGTKQYRAQVLTLKAKQATNAGDKINTFCIGGELEVRAGLLYEKVPLTGAQMHLGLGTYPKADVVRITWPTGNPQSEALEGLTNPLVADQRLGGSCPFLFAWNGKEMVFVTDCIWRSPLGLKINAQVTAGVTQTEDWIKIRGDQLQPRDGFYDLSITAELRETHFFDHLALMPVDHPEGTEIFIDERFSPTAPPLLKVLPTGPTHALKAARGWKGEDVTALVAARDKNYVDDFGRGQYQGVTNDHWIEVELSDDAPRGKQLYLIAHGWLHPTDTSINVALGQNPSQAPPQGLSLWTTDSKGNWQKRRDALGFPEGKLKTIVLRVDDLFAPGAPRRIRLRTNLEIFWDQIQWAEALPSTALQLTRLTPQHADLRYRGFSIVEAKDASSPELPRSYTQLAGLAPRWRDLEGYYTRFGDVRPLLTGIDDRYVIMNAGDELALRFPAAPAPKPGWKRDYVLIGDGWVKDGNVNTTFGQTVMPYPAHNIKDYKVLPASLSDDPVVKRHPQDWETYHTRYVTTDTFQRALKP